MTEKSSKPPVHVMSGLVVQGAFNDTLLPAFKAAEGITVDVAWEPTTVVMKMIAEGTRTDLLFLVIAAMDELQAKGLVDAATRVDVLHSRVGIAVPKGAPHPDISTVEAFVETLLKARSVAYSKAGASGIYFEQVLEKLGIAEQVKAKATVIPAGFTAEKLVTGEADIAVQQLSELAVVKGIEVVAGFPGPLEKITSFAAAIMKDATNPEGAARFLAYLTSDEAKAAYREVGLDPV